MNNAPLRRFSLRSPLFRVMIAARSCNFAPARTRVYRLPRGLRGSPFTIGGPYGSSFFSAALGAPAPALADASPLPSAAGALPANSTSCPVDSAPAPVASSVPPGVIGKRSGVGIGVSRTKIDASAVPLIRLYTASVRSSLTITGTRARTTP